MRQIYSPLDGFRSPFGRLMGSTAPFTPAVLFGASEPGVWYDPSDLTTLFQDTAGTLPVTTPGQTVALALDKSKGLVLGSEKIVNPNFNDASWWGLDAGWAITGGAAVNTAASQMYTPLGFIEVGKTYLISFDVSATTTSGNFIVVVGSSNITIPSVSGTGRYTLRASDATGGRLRFGSGSGHNWRGSLDNVTVKELPGFHATQATLASRPTYGIVPLGGRRNVFERSEEFDNVYWAKSTSATVTANDTLAPNGTATADRLASSATLAFGVAVFRGPNTVVSGATYRVSCYMKAGTAGWGSLLFGDGGSNAARFNFNLSTEQLGSAETFGSGWTYVASSASIQSVGNGWLRCSAAFVAGGTSATVSIAAANANNSASITSGQFNYLWGAQLETGSSATAYQRVTTGFDVTEAGVASLSYLSFDGVDDFLITPTITPGIDKVTVGAGLRKLSDVAQGMIYEHGFDSDVFLIGPLNTGVGNYGFRSAGTLSSTASASGFAAPVTNVVTGLGDISADLATLRVNGSQVAQATADQGTGNYTPQISYIGRRQGTSLPFNGQLYSLVVRFAATDLATVGQLESWINGKTGAYS